MWHMKTKVILACGCCCTWYSEKGHGKKHHESMTEIQKICILGLARILGKVLIVYEINGMIDLSD